METNTWDAKVEWYEQLTTHLVQFLFPTRISSDFPLLTNQCGNSKGPEEKQKLEPDTLQDCKLKLSSGKTSEHIQ